MPMHNVEIAEVFERVADLLEIEGANPFRIRAYQNAARIINGLPHDAAEMVQRGEKLTDLPGIGSDLAGKIETVMNTGKLPLLEELEEQMSPELVRIMHVPGLGGKRTALLHRELGISTLDELEQAARDKRIRDLEGFGAKTEQHILEGIQQVRGGPERVLMMKAERVSIPLVEHLRKCRNIEQVTVAGSYRRRRETVGDLDILALSKGKTDIMERFVGYDEVRDVVSQGSTRSTVILRSGLQVDLRVLSTENYGAALHYFTGSKAHNIAVRKLGVGKGLKISEYGVFRGDKRVGGATEEEIYESAGLAYVEPELREDQGEIEASRKNRLPHLVTRDDMRGDLHVHSNHTDGRYSIEHMARAAHERGHRYMALTDHSKRLTVAHGLDQKALKKVLKEIDHVNGSLRGITVLKGIEVDILEDGSLDLPDDILRELDLTVCSVHYKFGLSREKQTERVIRAMDNRFFTILGHPTGRTINKRSPFAIDMERVMSAARERGCYLEVNAQPERLDLSDTHCRMAKEMGVKVAISTDAHTVADLDLMRYGVDQARRGWMGVKDVINTLGLTDLRKALTRRR